VRSDDELSPDLTNPDDWLNDWEDQKPVSPAAYSFSGHERNHLFLSQQASQFLDISAVSGLDSDRDGRAFAWLDYDRDGWQDIVVVNANAPLVALYRNELGSRDTVGQNGRMIAVRFIGGNDSSTPNSQFSCRDGYGALVTVGLGDMTLVREHRCGEGFAAQNSATMIVGVGARDRVDSVRVQWPSGRVQEIHDVASGTLITFVEAEESDAGIVQEPYLRSLSTPTQVPVVRVAEQINLPLPKGPAATELGEEGIVMYTTMATWCPSCKKHLPAMEHLRRSFSKEQLLMVGVPIDDEDTPQQLESYLAKFHPAYELLTELPLENREGIRNHVTQTLKQDVLPVTVLTTPDGEIVDTIAGIPTVSDLKQRLEQQRGGVESP